MLFADDPPAWVASVLNGVVGAVITAAGGLLLWFLNRKRANVVRVQEVELYTVLGIAEAFRSHVVATYNGNPVESLSQIEVAITNQSPEPIKNIELRIVFPEKTKVLQTEIPNFDATLAVDDAQRVLLLKIPLLNSHRLHREQVTLRCLVDGQAWPLRAVGRGEGWSVQCVSKSTADRLVSVSSVLMSVGCLVSGFAGIGLVISFDKHLHPLVTFGLLSASAALILAPLAAFATSRYRLFGRHFLR